MKLAKTDFYAKKERKFFKKHPELIEKYGEILEILQVNPFENSLKTHKLKGTKAIFMRVA
jgi:mRNA-degrading endonuclease YafQ of YafQ-DinJ toxin-antitoxin module